nr:MAG TPA: hypothetical protein [Caudoviricetes sp.]
MNKKNSNFHKISAHIFTCTLWLIMLYYKH